MKIRIYFIAAIFFSCIFFPSLAWFKNLKISLLLKTIPLEEQYFLEVFLRALISHEDGNYVLFGDKPASFVFFDDLKKFYPEAFFLHRHSVDFFNPIAKGFKIWEKYAHAFLSNNFAIIKTRSFFPDHFAEVFLIHKKRLNKILLENFIEFKIFFSQFNSTKHLVDAIINDNSILEQICQHDHLLGMILGYGKENAALFEREYVIESFLFPEQNRIIANSEKPHLKPQPSSGFKTLEDELSHLRLKEGSILKPDDLFPIKLMLHHPLSFLVDVTKTDIHLLREKLQKQHRKSTQPYEKGKFLEVTLRCLAT